MPTSSRTRRAAAVLLVCGGLFASACTQSPGGGGSSNPVGADCTASPVVVAGAQLAGCNLGALDLSGLDLTGIDLQGANLAGANLSGANLTGANLSLANLTGANLTNANLTDAILSGALLFGALLIGALLTRTSFWDAFPQQYQGGGAGGGQAAPADGVPTGSQAWNPRGEPWCGEGYAPAAGSRSVRTDDDTSFVGAYFTDNEIRGLDFRVGDFTDATFDFRNAPWYGCIAFTGGRLHNVTFIGMSTQHVDFSNADLSATRWIGNTICYDTFDGANLTGALFVAQTQAYACADYSAEGWPYTPPTSVSFNGADLTGATFDGTSSIGDPWDRWAGPVDLAAWYYDEDLLADVFLNGPDFRGADLTGVTATAAKFGLADFDGATCPDGSTGSAASPCFPQIVG